MELVRMPKGENGKAHCYTCDRILDDRIRHPFDVQRAGGSIDRVNVPLRTIEVKRVFGKERMFVFELCSICALLKSPFAEETANYRYGLDLPPAIKPGEERISYKEEK